MSFELPGWVEPILNAYGIPWPDVDEDAFHWLQQPLRDFGKDLVAVSDAIESAIGDLQAGNPSQTLAAIRRYCTQIRTEFLDPIQSVCDELAGEPCEIAYQAVIDVKWVLIGLLVSEITEDVADFFETVVTLGADVALTAAEAYAIREAVREAIQFSESEVASQLQSLADARLDNFVNSLLNPFINSVEQTVENRVDAYLPHLVLGEAMAAAELDGSAAQRLHLNPEQLNQAVTRIWNSSQSLKQAASKLDGTIDEIFDRPDPSAPRVHGLSSSMRIALKSIVKTVKSDLVSGIEKLVYHVEKHFVTLLEDFVTSLEELDADARRAAGTERIAAAPEVVVVSAASAWVGASAVIGPTSGQVNATEAVQVQVEGAERVAFAAGVDPAQGAATSQQPGSDTSITGGSAGVENLGVSANPRGPGVAGTASNAGFAEDLNVGVDKGAPHVETAQASHGAVQGSGSHHGDQHASHIGVADSQHAGAPGVDHLQPKHSPEGPTTTTAGEASASTENVGTPSAASDSDAGQR